MSLDPCVSRSLCLFIPVSADPCGSRCLCLFIPVLLDPCVSSTCLCQQIPVSFYSCVHRSLWQQMLVSFYPYLVSFYLFCVIDIGSLSLDPYISRSLSLHSVCQKIPMPVDPCVSECLCHWIPASVDPCVCVDPCVNISLCPQIPFDGIKCQWIS